VLPMLGFRFLCGAVLRMYAASTQLMKIVCGCILCPRLCLPCFAHGTATYLYCRSMCKEVLQWRAAANMHI
jgi:lipoate synthase